MLKNVILKQFKRNYSIKVTNSKWTSVIGLEIHAQISSQSKLFSAAKNDFSSPINTNVTLFDCSTPGTLPVLNKKCVEAGVLTALALNCKINPVSMFDRKHYFYADMPAGYQITQQRNPIANDGVLNFTVYVPSIHKKPYSKSSKIKQIQLEQDSGKSLHDFDRSLIDLNRAGAPLMELVFEPDLDDGEEAAALVKELSLILLKLGTCSCKMEEGALRVDANISVHQSGDPLGTRTEVKNIGSIRGVASAVKYEIERQIKTLENNGMVVNETRAWDPVKKVTVTMRDKEEQQDYRYMPEPNLPPLHIAIQENMNGCVNAKLIGKEIPELPKQIRDRLITSFKISEEHALILVNEPILLKFFEEVLLKHSVSPRLVTNFLLNDLQTAINKDKLSLQDLKITPQQIGEILELVEIQTISRKISAFVLNKILDGDLNEVKKIIEINNWIQINDDEEITLICKELIVENPSFTTQYRNGKVKVFKAFLGVLLKKTNDRINMGKATKILKELLDEK